MHKIVINRHHLTYQKKDNKLLLAVPLTSKHIGLFYSDGTYRHYDPINCQIVFSIDLEDKVYDAESLNNEQLIITLVNKKILAILNLNQRKVYPLNNLPFITTHDDIIDSSLFFQSTIHVFHDSSSFYIQSQREDNQTIVYFTNKDMNYKLSRNCSKSYDLRDYALDQLDEDGEIGIYRQNPEIQGIWFLKIVSLWGDFKQKVYQIQHQAFDLKSTIIQVRSVYKGSYLVFVNGPKKAILVFQLQKKQIRLLIYQPDTNIQNTYIFKPPIILLSLFQQKISYPIEKQKQKKQGSYGQNFRDRLVLLNIQTQKVLERNYANLDKVRINYNNRILVNLDTGPSSLTNNKQNPKSGYCIFESFGFVNKKSLYMKMLIEQKHQERYGHSISQYVLDLLD